MPHFLTENHVKSPPRNSERLCLQPHPHVKSWRYPQHRIVNRDSCDLDTNSIRILIQGLTCQGRWHCHTSALSPGFKSKLCVCVSNYIAHIFTYIMHILYIVQACIDKPPGCLIVGYHWSIRLWLLGEYPPINKPRFSILCHFVRNLGFWGLRRVECAGWLRGLLGFHRASPGARHDKTGRLFVGSKNDLGVSIAAIDLRILEMNFALVRFIIIIITI